MHLRRVYPTYYFKKPLQDANGAPTEVCPHRQVAQLLVRNATRNALLGEAIEEAGTSAKRRTGLLNHVSLPQGGGLWIVPCEGIHTWGMKFAIDVAFLNRKRRVVKIRKDMGKRGFALCLWAHSVLELPAGTLERTGTQKGDQLEFDQ